MLSKETLNQIKKYTRNIRKNVSLVLNVGAHPKRNELIKFLKSIASINKLLSFQEQDLGKNARSPITFNILVENKATGISFSGIPNGHEFNSLILAILQAGGLEIKLDKTIKNAVKAIKKPIYFETFISLNCHNCPDIVQILNQFALINHNIKSEMIDGSLFKNEIEKRNILGVPAVYANNKLFANGKIDAVKIFDKILSLFPNNNYDAPNNISEINDVVIIGGGPAGVASAIYVARKGLKVTLITDRIGGQVKDTKDIENFISMSNTNGQDLSYALAQHMRDYDIRIKNQVKVTNVNNAKIKKITLNTGEELATRTIIIATGAKWRELKIPGEKENIGKGVAYCSHCDGPFFKNKNIAVVGGGNSGVEAAIDLSNIAKEVVLFEFEKTLKADPILLKKLYKKNNIKALCNNIVKIIHYSEKGVRGIQYQERDSGNIIDVNLDAVFVQIGLIPNTQLFSEILTLNTNKEIIINYKCETSAPGIYACGDATNVPYKQIITAMGEGTKAALSVFEYLIKN